MRFSLLITIVLFVFSNAFGQEVLREIGYNPLLKNQELKLKEDIIVDTLELPFIDDFSEYDVYPNAKKWIDRDAFINRTYPVLPPTIGVATLDAFNEKGNHYDTVGFFPYIADYLTSQAINLEYEPSDSIYLSFYFQPGGIGNDPEERDSLTVEFYHVDSSEWIVVWNTEGFSSDGFNQVLIPITDSIYLKKGFQFRFRNYVSFDSDVEAYFSNFDHWHIDYVYLDTDRNMNDTVIHDVAFVEAPRSVLKNFEAIPWGEHFKIGRVFEQGNLRYSFRNNDTILRNTAYTYYVSEIVSGNYQRYDSAYLGQINLDADSLLIKRYEIDDDFFEFNSLDESTFKIEYVIETDDFDYHQNDTVVVYQSFKNYYAYDDGTVENGYGLDAANGMVAYQFETYVEDTIQGVDMYFNHTYDNANQQFFRLRVWNDNDGVPGSVIHEQNVQVRYGEELNEFYTYEFDSSFTVSDIYYIGWQQSTEEFLNVGFDRNRNNNDKLFFNLSGAWYNSSFEGSLMMRPLFGQDISNSISNIEKDNLQLILYPNPATDKVFVEFDETVTDFQIFLFDNLGRLVHQTSQKEINTGNFASGIYNLILLSGNQKSSRKLLIQK